MTVRKRRQTPPAPRRKPRQSRAHHTSQALREAFVRLLVERGYAAITIREVTAVAGTGLGSFYEYFASKEDLARVCLHLRSKALLMAMRAAVAQHQGGKLAEVVSAVVDSQIEAHREQPLEWGAHYVLERHLSTPESYRKMYDRFVDEWVAALEAACDLPTAFPTREVARVSLTIIYGLFAHTYIGTQGQPDAQKLMHQVRTAILAYMHGAATPA